MSVPLPTPTRRAGRVVDSHEITRSAFQLSGLFILGAGIWAIYRFFNPGSWWSPLHTFMIGGVLLAISGATQLFSITWAAAIPPDRRLARTQRWLMAIGAGVVISGVTWGWDWLVVVGALLVGSGLTALATILVGVRRRSLVRRFGLSSRFYLLAMTAGLMGVALGAALGIGSAGHRYLDFRVAHMHLNFVGLVGFTIVGTLPTILPTMAHHKMVSGREAIIGFWLSTIALFAMVVGVVVGSVAVGIGVGLAGVGLAVTLVGILLRLGVRRILMSGLPGLLVSSGSLWLIGWMLTQSIALVGGEHIAWSRATGVGVGGVAHVLFGSLAYLIPVLAGRGSDLGANLERMGASPWVRISIANAAVIALVVGLPGLIVLILVATFGVDFAVRVALVFWQGRVSSPQQDRAAPSTDD